ncbi:hypothetical protein AX17_003198 [Amanita inopinata Kibby_2008]|nr:hypothetical protein AX17_003198 [Amanita inopinata Kibby_2008]
MDETSKPATLKRPLSSVTLPPGTLAMLTRLGYETIQDMTDISPDALAKDMNVSLETAKSVLSSIRRRDIMEHVNERAPSVYPLSLSQSVSSLVKISPRVSTKCIPVDKLLSGGITRGQVLEISGPPGSPKEVLLLKVVTAFVELGEEVIFLETQNMISPAMVHKALRQSPAIPSNCLRLVQFVRVQRLPEFIMFVRSLPALLETRPMTGLLVVDSINFPFQSDPTMSPLTKNIVLDQIKQVFAQACTLRQLTVVTSSQLSTKMLKADGSPGTFDDGARGIMQPALGTTYLPSGRSHRVIMIPKGRLTGTMKLIPPSANPIAVEPYCLRDDELM